MARPKTGDKRSAILSAATAMVAAHGLGASTASIAKAARVAEGSLFRYFADKDELLNELYRELKEDMRRAMATGFPAAERLKARARHIWDGYVSWGVNSPEKRKTMSQLTSSNVIGEQSRLAGRAGFEEIDATVQRDRRTRPPLRFARCVRLVPASLDGGNNDGRYGG